MLKNNSKFTNFSTLSIGYHLHLINALHEIFIGNYFQAENLVKTFLSDCKQISIIIYTPHSDLISLTKNNKNCCEELFRILRTNALPLNIDIYQGVEVGCVFENNSEAIHLGVIPYDQTKSFFKYFINPPLTGLNKFNPFSSKGEPQAVFQIEKILNFFQNKALLVYNHPEINSAEIQTRMLPLIKQKNLITEYNLAWKNTLSFLPIAWKNKGKISFEKYQGLIGWDLHGINNFINKFYTSLKIKNIDKNPQSILKKIRSQQGKFIKEKLSFFNIIPRVKYQIQEYKLATLEKNLRNLGLKKLFNKS